MTSKLERIEAALAEYERAKAQKSEYYNDVTIGLWIKANVDLQALTTPTALRELVAIAKAARAIEPYDFLADEFFECNVCKGKPIRNSQSVVVGYHHEDDCRVKALEDALKALDSE